ncbi:superoxide dismutase family protein [Sporosarcina jiandibaonis]|uniref:superoxide dismutase family protein n=1 Tax=Sporosarcina jiandibaonis TaxID=2715535 RepID=UPI001551F13F|nr:superoxide dismutase family protein [Sporosarcina jiandibaonis]
MKRILLLFISCCLLFVMSGCLQKKTKLPVSGDKTENLSAPFINVDGDEIGEVAFTENSKALIIDIRAEGLKPGIHGTHIHEKGECATPTFESAGGHFNPTSKEHGFDNPKGFHLGDLPNIEVAEDGTVNVSLHLTDITLKQGMDNSILDKDGSALVIHEGPDDYETDPAGNSGARIACAAITAK